MFSYERDQGLRRILFADGVVCFGSGLVLAAGATLLASAFGLPEQLLRVAGLILVPYGLFVAYIARREPLMRVAVWTIIIINVLWVLESLGLLMSGWVNPTVLGTGFVLVQALVGGIFAVLEFVGIRRTGLRERSV